MYERFCTVYFDYANEKKVNEFDELAEVIR